MLSATRFQPFQLVMYLAPSALIGSLVKAQDAKIMKGRRTFAGSGPKILNTKISCFAIKPC